MVKVAELADEGFPILISKEAIFEVQSDKVFPIELGKKVHFEID
jgi:hypothetical protein